MTASLGNALSILFAWLVLTPVLVFPGEPLRPISDAEVLERLRTVPLTSQDRELRRLRERLRSEPANLSLTLEVAQRLIEKYRLESEPRYLGYAEAAVEPWWQRADPPASTLLLRATLRQINHEFDAALGDLDMVLRIEPGNAQATGKTVLDWIRATHLEDVQLARLSEEFQRTVNSRAE